MVLNNTFNLHPVLTVGITFLLISLIGIFKKNNTFADLGWGLGFVIAVITSYLTGLRTLPGLIATLLVVVWGGRLTLHLVPRILKGEDYRYKEMRENWDRPVLNSFFKVYFLQFLLLLIVVSPVVHLQSLQATLLTPLSILFLALWVVGFLFETVGDYQLKKFKESEKEGVLKTGLWKYTRHPNYFGESLMWSSLALFTISLGGSPVVIISPVLLTFLLLKVSGVPLLEEKLMESEEYREYAEKTSKFFPLPPKK